MSRQAIWYTDLGHILSKSMIVPSPVRNVPGLTVVQPMRLADAAAAIIGSLTEFHEKPSA
jgi:hypothetical protein